MKDHPKSAPDTQTPAAPIKSRPDQGVIYYTRRHLTFGWWALLVFLTLGIVLESLHGFKAGFYLNVSNSTRRLMWTLAHAHGTLLALVHIGFGATAHLLPSWNEKSRGMASACLMSASILIPGGFFLGGLVIYSGDPGLGILLVPLGALLLFIAVFLTARGATTLKLPPGINAPLDAKKKPAGKSQP